MFSQKQKPNNFDKKLTTQPYNWEENFGFPRCHIVVYNWQKHSNLF